MTTQWLWSFSSDWCWQIRLTSIIARMSRSTIVCRTCVLLSFFINNMSCFRVRAAMMVPVAMVNDRARTFHAVETAIVNVSQCNRDTIVRAIYFHLTFAPYVPYNTTTSLSTLHTRMHGKRRSFARTIVTARSPWHLDVASDLSSRLPREISHDYRHADGSYLWWFSRKCPPPRRLCCSRCSIVGTGSVVAAGSTWCRIASRRRRPPCVTIWSERRHGGCLKQRETASPREIVRSFVTRGSHLRAPCFATSRRGHVAKRHRASPTKADLGRARSQPDPREIGFRI